MRRTIFILVLFVFVLSSCGGGRDLSTPSSRLVGHWKSINTVAMTEYYFGEIDEVTGKGKFTEYDTRDGSIAKGTYKVVSETPGGEDITILPTLFGYEDLDLPSGVFDFQMDLEVQADGLKAKMMSFYIEYIDDKTEFDLSDLKPTQIPTQTPTPTEIPFRTPTPDPNSDVYQVTMSTGLYETKTSDTAYQTIQAGELLIPANGASTALCEPSNRENVNAYMCYMQSLSSGKTGWVWRLMIVKID